MSQLPSARIYIQVQETREVIFCDTFTTIDTNLKLDGASTATVQLINKADRWFTFASRAVKKQTDLSQFLLDAYNAKRFVEINQKRQALLDQARKQSGNLQQQTLLEIYSMDQIVMMNLAYRIWIDFRGRKDLVDLQQQDSRKYRNLPDRWYAGFTGVITAVEDYNEPGKMQQLTISCRDMKRFFDTTMLVTQQGFNPVLTLDTDVVSYLKQYQANALAGFVDGAAIINFAADLINKTFHTSAGDGFYPFNQFWQLPAVDQIATPNAQNPNIEIVKPTYLGITHRRAPTGFSNALLSSDRYAPTFDMIQSKNVTLNQKKSDVIRFIQASDVTKEYVKDVAAIRPGFNPDVFTNAVNQQVQGQDTYQGADFSVDKMIVNGSANSNPYQQLIKQAFNWETSRISAAQAIKSVADLTGYYCYCDAKGNLIYQKQRFDDFPATEPGSNYDNEDESTSLPMKDEIGQYSAADQFTLGMGFHGRNYLIGDESILNWRITRDDANIVTNVIVPPGVNDLPDDPNLLRYATGVGFADPDISRRFGVRLYYAQQLFEGGFNRLIPQILAEGITRKMNASIETLQLALNMRPDLQLGRTLYMMERRRLFLITGVQNSLQWGKRHDTTITGEFGHHPFSPILDPWRIASLGVTITNQQQLENNIKNRDEIEQIVEQNLSSSGAQ